MSKQGLLICVVIPIFNRKVEVIDTIRSIAIARDACVKPDSIGLFFQDGGSTDGTQQALKEYAMKYEWLSYESSSQNGGVDLDTDIGVRNVNSKYIWLFSSDDLMENNSLRRVEELICSKKIDIILANRTNYSKDLNVCYGRQSWFHGDPIISEYIHGDRSVASYLDKTVSLGGAFSYMPAIIVLRNRWMAETRLIPTLMNGTNYRHVLLMLKILAAGAYLYSEPVSYVACRSFNDSFHGEGTVGRFLIDYVGYDKVIRCLNSSTDLEDSLRACVRRELGLLRIIRVCGSMSSEAENKALYQWLEIYKYQPIQKFLFKLFASNAFFRHIIKTISAGYFAVFK